MYTSPAKEELATVLPTSMSHYFQDEPEYLPEPTVHTPGLFARLGGALRWLLETPKRYAVMEELSRLSDHELADIGLNRSQLSSVFDPEFAAARDAERGVARSFVRRAALA